MVGVWGTRGRTGGGGGVGGGGSKRGAIFNSTRQNQVKRGHLVLSDWFNADLPPLRRGESVRQHVMPDTATRSNQSGPVFWVRWTFED